MLAAFVVLLVLSGRSGGLPKTSTTEGGVLVNELPLAVQSRPRIEQPYLRHGPTSDSRRSEGRDFCRRPAKCKPILNSTCLTTKVPYTHTSIELVGDVQSQEDIQVRGGCFSKLVLVQPSCIQIGETVALAKLEKCPKMLGSNPAFSVCPLYA